MNTINYRPRAILGFVCILALALPSLGKASGSCGFEQEMAAHDWLSTRAASTRTPIGYGELAPLPKALAAAVLHRLPPQQQAAIWRQRLAVRAKEAHPDQQEAVYESASLITADLFARAARQGGDAVSVEIGLIVDTLSRSFGPRDIAEILSMGTMAPPPIARAFEKDDPDPEPRCNCYDSSDCFGQFSCIPDEQLPCEYRNWGCGYFFLFPCTGRCCFWMNVPGGGHWAC